MSNGGEVGTTFYDNFLRFLDHFISIFSKENGYDKFQLLKLSIKKIGCYLFCYVQYEYKYLRIDDNVLSSNT